MKGNKEVRNIDWRQSCHFQVTGSFMGNIPGSKSRRTICSLPPGTGACISPRTGPHRLVTMLTLADNGQEPKYIFFQCQGPHSKTREPGISRGLGCLTRRLALPLGSETSSCVRKGKVKAGKGVWKSRISSGFRDYSTSFFILIYEFSFGFSDLETY